MADPMTPEQMAALRAAQERLATRRAEQPAVPALSSAQQAAIDAAKGRIRERTGINVDATGQDTMEDVVKSLGSGALRGAAGLVDLPSDLAQLGAMGYEKVTGNQVSPETMERLNFSDAREHMRDWSGGFSERRPETNMGRYAATIGEFAPGAIAATLTGGGSLVGNLARGAVAPAIASEAAGQAAEAMGYDPTIARVAGAFAGGMAASKAEGALRKIVTAGQNVNPQRLAYADRLRRSGVGVTAGQATGDARLMGIEARTARGQDIFANQHEQATAAMMNTIGSNSRLATADAINDATDRIVNRLTTIADSADSIPQVGQSAQMARAVMDYNNSVTSTSSVAPKIIKDIIDDIDTAAASGVMIPGAQLRQWRTSLGRMAASTNDPAVANLYHTAVDTIDDMVAKTLTAQRRLDDLNDLKEARGMYRNMLAIRDASLKSDSGVLRPIDVRNALARQGKAALATNRRGDLGELAMAAQNILKAPASADPNQVRGFLSLLFDAMGGGGGMWIGSTLGGLPGGILGSIVGAGGTIATQKVFELARRLMASPIMQDIIVKNAARGMSSAAPFGMPSITGLQGAIMGQAAGGRVERKAGGRVGVNHDKLADQLVTAAERAKKGISKGTEQLLDLPDDHIAHALEVANRSI